MSIAEQGRDGAKLHSPAADARRHAEQSSFSEAFQKIPKVGLIGLGRCGKGTVRAYLEKTYGFMGMSVSDLIRQFALEHGIALRCRNDWWETGITMQKQLGADVFERQTAARLASLYQEAPTRLRGVALDGIRIQSILDSFRNLGNTVIIAISAPVEDRYARYCASSQPPHQTMAEFQQDEGPELSSIWALMKQATYTLENEGDIPELLREVQICLAAHFQL